MGSISYGPKPWGWLDAVGCSQAYLGILGMGKGESPYGYLARIIAAYHIVREARTTILGLSLFGLAADAAGFARRLRAGRLRDASLCGFAQ